MARKDAEKMAWDAYLREIRSFSPAQYDEAEPWAWAKLQKELLRIHNTEKQVA